MTEAVFVQKRLKTFCVTFSLQLRKKLKFSKDTWRISQERSITVVNMK